MRGEGKAMEVDYVFRGRGVGVEVSENAGLLFDHGVASFVDGGFDGEKALRSTLR